MLFTNRQIKHGCLALYLVLSLILVVQVQAPPASNSVIQTFDSQKPHDTITSPNGLSLDRGSIDYARSSIDSSSVGDSVLFRFGAETWQKTDAPSTTSINIPAAPDLAFYSSHAPIVIESNADFAGWPGAGLPGNPYIISGLEIYITNADACIKISNTDAYFVIENCYLHSNSTENVDIDLYGVTNGLIYNNTCSNSQIGILANNTSYVTIQHNICNNQSRSCIHLNESHDITVDNNTAIMGWSGIYLEQSDQNTIKNNYATGCQVGINLYWSSDLNSIHNNNITLNNNAGITLYLGCEQNSIDGNSLTNNPGTGIYISSSDNNALSNNLCYHNFYEIRLETTDFTTIDHNNLSSTAGSVGLNLFNSNHTIITNNFFYYIEECAYISSSSYHNTFQFNNFTFFDYGIDSELGGDLDINQNYFNSTGNTVCVYAVSTFGLNIEDNYGTFTEVIFYTESCENVHIINNYCYYYSAAIGLINTNSSVVEDNYCEYGDLGIATLVSHDVTINNNTAYNHDTGGIDCEESSGLIVTNNNCTTTTQNGINFDACDEVQIENNLCFNFTNGINLLLTNNTKIINNDVKIGVIGVNIETAVNVSVIGNEVLGIPDDTTGISVDSSEYIFLSENSITQTYTPAILLSSSLHCNATKNTINDTIDGIVLSGTNDSIVAENMITFGQGYGLGLWTANNNLVRDNHVANISGWEGYALVCNGIENVFTDNLGCNSTYGFWIEGAINCTLTHSTIYGNHEAFWFSPDCSNNNMTWNIFDENLQNGWDDSLNELIDYNYWSNYTGIDANGDGIGDTPQPIDGSALNNDTHPLVYYPTLFAWTEEPTDQNAEYGMDFSYTLSLTMTSKQAPVSEWWLYGNDFVIDNGVITNVGTPSPGVYSFEVRAYNVYGFYLDGFFTITVEDTIAPTIAGPQDFSYTVGTTGHVMTWHPDDLGPVSYSLTLDGAVVESGAWNTTLENITYSADGLSIGEHTFILTVTDIGGHSTSDTVVVTVVGGFNNGMLILAIGASGAIIALLVGVYYFRKRGPSS